MPIKISEHISWISQPPGRDYRYNYERVLYHREEYCQAQRQQPTISRWLVHQAKKRVLGSLHWYVRGRHAISQHFAPFGSFNGATVSGTILQRLLTDSTRELQQMGTRSLVVIHPPIFYGPNSVWPSVLLNAGFTGRNCVNHHLAVDETPFKDKIHLMERRKLARCGALSFQVEPTDRLREIHRFIATCRQQRGQQLSMSQVDLERVVAACPSHFLLCTVRRKSKIAAATVVIKVTTRHWYNFLPAHNKEYDAISPVVFLVDRLYDLARKDGVEAIDLGTSELEGQPLLGLMKFKSRIGGLKTARTTYYKDLTSVHATA